MSKYGLICLAATVGAFGCALEGEHEEVQTPRIRTFENARAMSTMEGDRIITELLEVDTDTVIATAVFDVGAKTGELHVPGIEGKVLLSLTATSNLLDSASAAAYLAWDEVSSFTSGDTAYLDCGVDCFCNCGAQRCTFSCCFATDYGYHCEVESGFGGACGGPCFISG